MAEVTRPARDIPARIGDDLVVAPSSRTAAAIREVLLPLLVLLAVLVATAVAYNNTATYAVAADDDVRFVFHGMYSVERNDTTAYRWTSGQGSVCLEQWGQAALGMVRVALLGQGAVPHGPTSAELTVGSAPLAVVPLQAARRQYHLMLSRQQQRGDDFCLGLGSRTASAPGDARQLGVPFIGMEVQRIGGMGLVRPAAVQLLLNLALALICFWALRFLGLPAWLSALAISALALLLSLGIASGKLTSGIGVTRNQVPLVGLGTIVLGGALGVRFTRGQGRERRFNDLLQRDLLSMGFWSVALTSGVWMIQQAQGRHGVWPLKAGVWPNWTPLIAIPALAFAVWLAAVLWQLHRDQDSTALLLGTLLLGALLLPVMLKVSVRGWDSLFSTFRDNPADYIHDVPRVGNPIRFLDQYVEISPSLAWHSANHPPGSVLLLWFVDRVFGSGAVPATWVVMSLGCLNAIAAFWLGLRLGGRKLAFLAGALLVVMPAFQAYNVTSMDTIFSAMIALGGVALYLALEPRASVYAAVLAGLLSALALMLTYAATQLVFWGTAVLVLSMLRHRVYWPPLRQALIAAGTLVAFFALVDVAAGFNILEGALQATANNSRLVRRSAIGNTAQLLAPPTLTYYVHFLSVNIVPYFWYLAPWGLAALTPAVLKSWRVAWLPGPFGVLALGLVCWVAGMWLSGLFIREVERIWAFTYPIAAVLIARHVWQGETRRQQLWRAGLFISLYWVQSAVMRMLLNLYW